MTSNNNLADIRNFHQVTEWLYRGGQPTHDGIAKLAAMGIKTVVSFRTGPKVNEAERRAVEAAGMAFVSIPIYYASLPKQREIDQVLALLDTPSNYPVFIHCFHGADRTGFFVAVFRMARMGWSVDEAYAEMKQLGFHRFRLPHFKWMLWKYARVVARQEGNKPSDYSVKRT